MHNEKIMLFICENDASIAKILSYYIKKYFKVEIKIISNKVDYIKTINLIKPDILLTEYQLPYIKGIEILKIAKKIYPDIQTIMIIDNLDVKKIDKLFNQGVTYLIQKNNLIQIPIAIKNSLNIIKEKILNEQTELQLKNIEKLYKTLFNSMTQGVIFENNTGNIIEANPAAKKILKMHSSKIKNLTEASLKWKVIHEDGRIFLNKEYPSTLALINKKPIHNIIMGVYNHKMKDYIWLNVSAVPVFKENKEKLNYVFIIFEDITRFKNMAQMQIQHDKANFQKEKIEALSLMAAGIGHDFNNMLMGIMANIAFARMNTKNTKILQILSDAEFVAQKATALVKQLMSFSLDVKPQITSINIKEFVEKVIRFSIRGKQIKLVLDFDKNVPFIKGDEAQLQQSINNIVLNALQAMKGRGTLITKISTEYIKINNTFNLKPGYYVKISFKDTGSGINQDKLSKIFDPYFTTKKNGNGLGLTSVYTIIKKHKGAVHIISEYKKGCEVIMYLPAQQNINTSTDNDQENVEKPKFNGKVLIMDDEPFIRRVTQKMFTYLGFNVTVCSNGTEAISLYKKEYEKGKPYKFVITDLTVPGGYGGVEVVREILNIDENAVLIIASGYYDEDTVIANYKDYGFKAVLRKPYSLNDIYSILKKIFV